MTDTRTTFNNRKTLCVGGWLSPVDITQSILCLEPSIRVRSYTTQCNSKHIKLNKKVYARSGNFYRKEAKARQNLGFSCKNLHFLKSNGYLPMFQRAGMRE